VPRERVHPTTRLRPRPELRTWVQGGVKCLRPPRPDPATRVALPQPEEPSRPAKRVRQEARPRPPARPAPLERRAALAAERATSRAVQQAPVRNPELSVRPTRAWPAETFQSRVATATSVLRRASAARGSASSAVRRMNPVAPTEPATRACPATERIPGRANRAATKPSRVARRTLRAPTVLLACPRRAGTPARRAARRANPAALIASAHRACVSAARKRPAARTSAATQGNPAAQGPARNVRRGYGAPAASAADG
jgi:hypothetical protein